MTLSFIYYVKMRPPVNNKNIQSTLANGFSATIKKDVNQVLVPDQQFKGKRRDLKKFQSKFQETAQPSFKYSKKKRCPALSLALNEYNNKKTEHYERKKENKRKKEEMTKALQRYKETKSQKLKKMSKKTKKGQPIMKYWMESLLEEIQKKTV